MKNPDGNGVWSGRRRVLLAAVTGAIAPLPTFATADDKRRPAVDRKDSDAAGRSVVLSGCVTNGDAEPLCGTSLEIRCAKGTIGRATTDGAGRFVLEMPAAAGDERLTAHVAGRTPQVIRFAPASGCAIDCLAQTEADVAGVWRAAVAISLA